MFHPTHRQPGPARLYGGSILYAFDALLHVQRSGLLNRAVSGFFFFEV